MSTYMKPERRTELCSVERYTLDLRKTGIPEEAYGTLLLPVCRGKYFYDFDVLVDELEPCIREKIETAAKQHTLQRVGKYGITDVPDEWGQKPPGFNVKTLPAGTALVRGWIS